MYLWAWTGATEELSRCGETVSRTTWPDREGRGSQGRKRPPEKRCWSSDPKEGRASRGVVQAEGPRWPHRFTLVAVAIQKRTGSCPADVTRASGHSVRARAGRSGEGHTVLTRTRHWSRGSRAETCDASLAQPRTEVRLAPRPLVPLGSPCGLGIVLFHGVRLRGGLNASARVCSHPCSRSQGQLRTHYEQCCFYFLLVGGWRVRCLREGGRGGETKNQ